MFLPFFDLLGFISPCCISNSLLMNLTFHVDVFVIYNSFRRYKMLFQGLACLNFVCCLFAQPINEKVIIIC